MSKSKVKICGIRRLEDADILNELKPDFAGLVFYEKSKRNVSRDMAMQLRERLSRDIEVVGVFVDSPVEFVADLMNSGIIDMAQLHGHEDEDYIRSLRAKLRMKVGTRLGDDDVDKRGSIIKAFLLDAGAASCVDGVDAGAGNPDSSESESTSAPTSATASTPGSAFDRVLQAAAESSADYILFDKGLGCGEQFDWSILKDFSRPYFLAGGLNIDTVTDAIELLHPYALDVSSSVEIDGKKDRALVEAFIKKCRA